MEMKFKDLHVEQIFTFKAHPGLLHEKVSAQEAKQLSSVKIMTPFRVNPEAEVEHN
jgi:hypothetical protein